MENDTVIHTRGACTIRDGSRLRDLNVCHDPLIMMEHDPGVMLSDDLTRGGYETIHRWRTMRLIPAFRRGILDGADRTGWIPGRSLTIGCTGVDSFTGVVDRFGC